MSNRKRNNVFIIICQIIIDGVKYGYYRLRYLILGKDQKEVIYIRKKKK